MNTPVDWINILDCGASTTSSDNTQALLEAIGQARAAGSGTIYVPAGVFNVKSPIPLTSHIKIQGNNQYGSILNWTQGTDGFTGVDLQHITIQDLGITGASQSSGNGTGLNLTRSSQPNVPYLDLQRVVFQNWGQDSVAVSNPIVSSFRRVTAQTSGRHGFYTYGVPNGAAGTSTNFDTCYVNANNGSGYFLTKMNYCHLSGCAADNNGIGYDLLSCYSVKLSACGAEGQINKSTTFPGYSARVSGCNGVALDQLMVYANASTGIYVTGNSQSVSLNACQDLSPSSSAKYFVQVDRGCSVQSFTSQGVTGNSYAIGTVQVLAGSV